MNYAGFVAENVMEGRSHQVTWRQVDALAKGGALLLDVRTPEEFVLGHLAGAINIPNTEIRARRGRACGGLRSYQNARGRACGGAP